jgi:hypothetical protein
MNYIYLNKIVLENLFYYFKLMSNYFKNHTGSGSGLGFGSGIGSETLGKVGSGSGIRSEKNHSGSITVLQNVVP